MRVLKFILAASVCSLVPLCGIRAQSSTNTFGFTGHETYPIDPGIALLHAADLTGDGLNDLIVVNNPRGNIDLLYNQTGNTNRAAKPPRKLEINELPLDARFRVDSISVDEHIAALSVADVNGDGRPDFVFYGDTKDLEIIYNQGTNGWSEPKRWRIEDGRMDANALVTGDLDGDGLPDIVLLGDNGSLYFLPQQPGHTFGEPQKIPYSGAPKAVQIVDVNGDGRKDLLLVDWETPTPFRFRLQNASGQLGPEIYFKSHPVRSYSADNLEGGDKNFVVTIAQNSSRAEVWEFTRKLADVLPSTPGRNGRESGGLRQGQFQILPLNKTDASQRGEFWADVNGDGRPDLLVAEPENGQISVYLQQADGALAPPKTFPSLAGVSQLAAADWNGDGHPEIFMLSQSEHAVGVTEFDGGGRLPFPTIVPLDGKPLAMAVGALKPGANPSLCMIVDKDGHRSLVTQTADGKTRTQKLSDSFKSNPAALAIHDVNQDGLADLVILIPYEKIKVLLQKPGGDFDEEDVDPPGGVIDQPWLASADVEGNGKPELLLPQKNFVRAVVLEQEANAPDATNKPAWVFRVKDQINGASSDSRIVGATAVMNGTTPGGFAPYIFLLDAEHQQLTTCVRDTNGVWRVVRNVELPVADFNSLQCVTLGGDPADKTQSVALLGQNAVGWLQLVGNVWEFTALDGYDTPIRDGYLNDVVAGDLTGSGRKDLIFMETAKNNLDLVRFDKNHKLVPGDRWQVFEQHTFRSATGALPEPREALVADVTGDGKKDLVVLVHDRILVYPQE